MSSQKSIIVFTDGEPDDLIALLVLVDYVKTYKLEPKHVLVIAQTKSVSPTAQKDVCTVVGDNVRVYKEVDNDFPKGNLVVVDWCLEQIAAERPIIIFQIAPTTMRTVHLIRAIMPSEVHIQGGTREKNTDSELAYNWNESVFATALLLDYLSVRKYTSVFLYTPTLAKDLFGGSMNGDNSPNAIKALLNPGAPPPTRLIAKRINAHDKGIVQKFPHVKERMGKHIGKQVCPADILAMCEGLYVDAKDHMMDSINVAVDVNEKKMTTAKSPFYQLCHINNVNKVHMEMVDVLVAQALSFK